MERKSGQIGMQIVDVDRSICMSKFQPGIGHIYGLKTRNGIALLQLAEEPVSMTSLQMTRICSGFLQEGYTEEDINRIIESRELFFMETPLHIIKRRSKLYKMFFEFDQQCGLPQTCLLYTSR